MSHRSVISSRLAASRGFFIAIALSVAAPGALAAGITGFSLSVGADYTVGDYGSAADTKILSIPVTGKFELGSWIFGLTVPYIRIDGPGDVVGGDGIIVTKRGKNRGNTTSTVQEGLGDVIVRASYTLLNAPAMPLVDLTGKVKVPTADENKNLGTGEYDYTVLLEAAQKFGSISPYGSIGYRYVGEPDGVHLNNQVLLNVGASVKMTQDVSAGLSFDYRSSTSDETDDPAELTPYVSWKFAPTLKLHLYSVVGLSDGSPDYGGGLQLVLAP